ncbi:hypothetical protein COR52_27675 [Vibrio mediterranei]|uniref:Uncharacterized protein n=1 Tax=Vibrio mediterranei TaxID=689 RepID=A0ABX5D6A4_9VIBR|nr:hypothetical protein COR52_27675 [Vibrio mediterranei]PRQ64472.1 hypothetical protein COR51_27335 [Vibrio mediterranei]
MDSCIYVYDLRSLRDILPEVSGKNIICDFTLPITMVKKVNLLASARNNTVFMLEGGIAKRVRYD